MSAGWRCRFCTAAESESGLQKARAELKTGFRRPSRRKLTFRNRLRNQSSAKRSLEGVQSVAH